MILEKMTDKEILELIGDLKHEYERRHAPTKGWGEIRVILKSSATDESGEVFENEPQTVLTKCFFKEELEAIKTKNKLYYRMAGKVINELNSRFIGENLAKKFDFTVEDFETFERMVYEWRTSPNSIRSQKTDDLISKLQAFLYPVTGGLR